MAEETLEQPKRGRTKVKVDKPLVEERKRHHEYYNDDNIKSKTISRSSKVFPNNCTKEKFVESTCYSNGVIKNKLVGVKKDSRQMWGREK